MKTNALCLLQAPKLMANANIHVYNGVTRVNITESKIDADGYGTIFFDCSVTAITSVILTKSDGSVCSVAKIAAITETSTLPIFLSSFKASVKNNGTAELTWASSMEIDSKHFVVQRSTDGKNYIDLATVAAGGNTKLTNTYQYTDLQLGNSAVYYRLKMVDIDEKFEYSKVVYVNNKNGNTTSLSIFPNPFRSDVQLVGVAAADVNKQNIRIYDVAGKQVNFSITGSNAISIDPNAPRGIYILRVKEQNFKLVKE
ncbi:MAG: T9SS type A sorting domain-containing protein [Chitinophagaceae bacterium]